MKFKKYNLLQYISYDEKNLVIDLFDLNNKKININFVFNLYSIINKNKKKYTIQIIIPKKYKFDKKIVIINNNDQTKLNIFFYNLLQFIFDLDQKNVKVINK